MLERSLSPFYTGLGAVVGPIIAYLPVEVDLYVSLPSVSQQGHLGTSVKERDFGCGIIWAGCAEVGMTLVSGKAPSRGAFPK